ncbi:MAG TPA: hypothetical protein DEP65_05735 [Ruminococcus sp.]|nr:hypothetical protein [Ruminococcus sp.]
MVTNVRRDNITNANVITISFALQYFSIKSVEDRLSGYINVRSMCFLSNKIYAAAALPIDDTIFTALLAPIMACEKLTFIDVSSPNCCNILGTSAADNIIPVPNIML